MFDVKHIPESISKKLQNDIIDFKYFKLFYSLNIFVYFKARMKFGNIVKICFKCLFQMYEKLNDKLLSIR